MTINFNRGVIALAIVVMWILPAGAVDLTNSLDGELVGMGERSGVLPGVSALVGAPVKSAESASEAKVGYDRLPISFSEMNRYEQMAMTPFEDYDILPLHEKARLYAQQFEAMNNRKPNYPPGTLKEIEMSSARYEPGPVELRRNVYKQSTPGKGVDGRAMNMSSLPEMRSGGRAAGPAPEAKTPSPDPGEDGSMERLRGWNLRSAVSGDH